MRGEQKEKERERQRLLDKKKKKTKRETETGPEIETVGNRKTARKRKGERER